VLQARTRVLTVKPTQRLERLPVILRWHPPIRCLQSQGGGNVKFNKDATSESGLEIESKGFELLYFDRDDRFIPLIDEGDESPGAEHYRAAEEFQRKVDRLRSLRPVFVAVIERLVDDALAEEGLNDDSPV
jgi:hypothetical protein